MNKTWIAVLVGAFVISAVGLGIQHIAANPDDAQLTSTEIRDIVKDKYPGEITELELERENGQLVYEVEIEGPEGEYEMKLDASTAEIVKLEEKRKRASKDGQQSEQANDVSDEKIQQASPHSEQASKQKKDAELSENARISIEEAKEIALNEIPGTIDEVALDREDGLLVYEIEIKTNNGEAEVEVDAYTGEVVMISWDD